MSDKTKQEKKYTHLTSLRKRNRDFHRTVLRQPVRNLHVTETVVLDHEHRSRGNRQGHHGEINRGLREAQARVHTEALEDKRQAKGQKGPAGKTGMGRGTSNTFLSIRFPVGKQLRMRCR